MNTVLVLLGGSTGGPAAVKAFIDALPSKTLPVCFVLANHITGEFLPGLQAMLDEHPFINAEVVDGTKPIVPGKLYIAPIDKQLKFNPNGRIYLEDTAWESPFAPNISQMFSAVTDLDRMKKLAIIFSGMDDDGASSADILDRNDVEIWCQSLETCVQASMPLNMMRTGKVIYKDSPEGLARQLCDYLESHHSLDQYA